MSERIIVTGAAGFIGSRIVRVLNARGHTDIIAVDDLRRADKFHNLASLSIGDYLDKSEFYGMFEQGRFGAVQAVFHEGACSDTMEHDGRYMMQNNYRTSRLLLDTCQSRGIRLLYASSAATYGRSTTFVESPEFEQPLNVYGYSKLLFDQVVRRRLPRASTQIAGFRYFNVYGPGEQAKGRMASVAFHQIHRFQETGRVELFGAYGGRDAGEHARDFVWVDDVVAVNLWFLDHPQASGIFNVGSGRAESFNRVAHAVINQLRARQGLAALSLPQLVADGLIDYVPFPKELVGKYQCHTRADLQRLRAVGCEHAFAPVEHGIAQYVRALAGEVEAPAHAPA